MDYRVYTSTEKSWDRGHKENEDCLMFSEYKFQEDLSIRLLVVADGVGGLRNGKQASMNAVKGFLNSFYSQMSSFYIDADQEDFSIMDEFSIENFAPAVREMMIKAVLAANESVCELADSMGEGGSTLTAVCVVGGYAVAVNVGDSPAYLYRKKDRKIRMVSKLQTKAEAGAAAGLFEYYSLEYYECDNEITCGLGKYRELDRSEVHSVLIGKLEEGDVLLIGSDGAFGRMMDGEILEKIESCSERTEGFFLQQLFHRARKDKYDDQSAILYVAAKEES